MLTYVAMVLKDVRLLLILSIFSMISFVAVFKPWSVPIIACIFSPFTSLPLLSVQVNSYKLKAHIVHSCQYASM